MSAPSCPCGAPATHRWEGVGLCVACKRDVMRAWFARHAADVVARALDACGVRGARVETRCDGPITEHAESVLARTRRSP